MFYKLERYYELLNKLGRNDEFRELIDLAQLRHNSTLIEEKKTGICSDISCMDRLIYDLEVIVDTN